MGARTGLHFERELVGSTGDGVVLVKLAVGSTGKQRFVGGGAVDFLGVIRGVPVAIEAKSCRGTRFALSRVTDKQVQFMKNWEAAGGRAFLLVRFGYRAVQAVAVPYSRLEQWLSSGKKSITIRDIPSLIEVPRSHKRWVLESIISS